MSLIAPPAMRTPFGDLLREKHKRRGEIEGGEGGGGGKHPGRHPRGTWGLLMDFDEIWVLEPCRWSWGIWVHLGGVEGMLIFSPLNGAMPAVLETTWAVSELVSERLGSHGVHLPPSDSFNLSPELLGHL